MHFSSSDVAGIKSNNGSPKEKAGVRCFSGRSDLDGNNAFAELTMLCDWILSILLVKNCEDWLTPGD